MNLIHHNQQAWTQEVARKNCNSIPISPEAFAEARAGEMHLPLTPRKAVPLDWIGDLHGKSVLCLAASGGQQAPLLALLGADVTVFDLCPEQLDKDRQVADREHLTLRLEQGEMTDLSRFADETFDLIFHAVSNCFIPEIQGVWNECFRVLKFGGTLISGFWNPVNYLFDMDEMQRGHLVVKYRIPYSDLEQLDPARLAQYIAEMEPLEFGHTLEDQIGGQIRAGFSINGFYEDDNGGTDPLDAYLSTFIATRAYKQ